MLEGALTSNKVNPAAWRRGLYPAGAAALLLAAAVFAHLRVMPVAQDYAGVLAPLDRLFDLLLATALIGVAFCVGRAVGRGLKLGFHNLAEEAAFSAMLGTGVVGTLVLGLGLAGLLRPLPVGALLVLLLALTWREAARAAAVVRLAAAAVTRDRTRRVLTLLFMLLVAALALRAATPPHVYDEAIYHLAVPARFVARGRVYPVIDNLVGNMPFLLHMMYAVCLVFKADIAAKLFSLLLALAAAAGLYGFCARFVTRRAGVVALFGFFGAGMVVEVAVTTRVDVTFAGLCFLAAYAMIVYFETRRAGWLWASALLGGFGLGVKYPAAIWVGLLGLLFVAESLRRREPLLAWLRRGLVYAALAAAAAAPWYVKNYVWFHNPIYPLATGEVAEYEPGRPRYFDADDRRRIDAHFAAARQEAPALANAVERELADAAARRDARDPLRFWEYFTRPEVYNVAEPYLDPNYLFLLAPLAFLFDRRRWFVWLAASSALFFLIVTQSSYVGRYLLPIYPALTLLAAVALVGLADRMRARVPLAAHLPAIALVATVGLTAFVNLSLFKTMDGPQFVAGALSRAGFMSHLFYYPSINYINRRLPDDARVLIIGTQMCYDLRRDYISDTTWNTTEWQRLLSRNATFEGVTEDLKSRGVTHVLYSPNLFRFAARIGREGHGGVVEGAKTRGLFRVLELLGLQKRVEASAATLPDYHVEMKNWTTFELYRRKWLEQTYEDPYCQVFRIK